MLDFIMHAFQVVTAQTLNMSARMPALSKQTEKYYNKNIYPSVESTSEYNPYSSYFVFLGGNITSKEDTEDYNTFLALLYKFLL